MKIKLIILFICLCILSSVVYGKIIMCRAIGLASNLEETPNLVALNDAIKKAKNCIDNNGFNSEYKYLKSYKIKRAYPLNDVFVQEIEAEIHVVDRPIFAEAPEFEIDNNGKLLSYKGKDEKVIIPNTVKSIGDSVFALRTEIEEVVIPETVSEIGAGAFFACRGINKVTFSDSIKNIEPYAFYNCDSLKNIILPNNLENIGIGAFSRSGLVNIVIPGTVKNIGEYAFDECDYLEAVKLQNGIENLKFSCFTSTRIKNINIPSSVNTIESFAFRDNDELLEVIIEDGVKNINIAAFDKCMNLEKIVFPGSVKTIKSFTLEGSKIRELILGEGIETIEEKAFYSNSNNSLMEILLPKSLKKLGEKSFAGFYGLRTVNCLSENINQEEKEKAFPNVDKSIWTEISIK